jgi:hypothetical protein
LYFSCASESITSPITMSWAGFCGWSMRDDRVGRALLVS